jgi:hypothetical protein
MPHEDARGNEVKKVDTWRMGGDEGMCAAVRDNITNREDK